MFTIFLSLLRTYPKYFSFIVENNPDTAFFTIHGKTGQILTKEVLDHEAKNRYLFSVAARDGGTPPRETTTSVQVRYCLNSRVILHL